MANGLSLIVFAYCFSENIWAASAEGNSYGLNPVVEADMSYGPNPVVETDVGVKAVCTISALGFGPSLTKAAMDINAAVADCGHAEGVVCAADVLQVVESCSWIAAFIVAGINDCTKPSNAACAGAITSLVASITTTAQASAGIAVECPGVGDKPHQLLNVTGPPSNIGMCVVDSYRAAWALARAGIFINSAISKCDNGPEHVCAANALAVVTSIIQAAEFALSATNKCSYTHSAKVGCAHASTKLARGVTSIAATSLMVTQTCVGLPTYSRRLSSDTTAREPLSAVETAYLAKFNMTERDLTASPEKVLLAITSKETGGTTNSVVV